MQNTTNRKERMRLLLKQLSAGIYERDYPLAMALLSAVAGESCFLLGLPGVGKSLVARRLKSAFRGATAFEYLMSRFSTPDEIFGPVSISKLKDEDTYERLTDGYLPSADVVFLDEIWKAGPSIQNALLTVLNEKRFRNGRTEEELPLKAVIAASNELPAEGEGLEALWDRFVVRLVVPPLEGKEAFRAMICGHTHLATEVDEELQISNEEYRQWSQSIDDVEVDEEVLTLIDALRDELSPKSEEEDTIENFISDRRWKKLIRLARTAAFLEGRERVLTEECMLFASGLWNSDTHRIERTERTERMVTGAIFRPLYNRLEEFKQTHKRIVEQMLTTAKLKGISLSRYRIIDYKYYNIVGFSEGQTLISKELFDSLSQRIATLLTLTPYDETGNTLLSKEVTQPRPRRVSLLRSVNGVRIDGVEYPLELSPDGNVARYFPKELAELQQLEEQLDRFHEEVVARVRELTAEKSRPLFMSSEQLQRLRSEGNRLKLQTKKFKNLLYALQ